MTEPNYGDYIAYNHAFIISVAIAQRAAGAATLPEIGAVCRKTAESMEDNISRSLLLGMAETLEAAGVDGDPAPLWTPELIPGGKDNSGKTAGPQALKEAGMTEIADGARGEVAYQLGGESYLLKSEFGVMARIQQGLGASLFERVMSSEPFAFKAREMLRTIQVVLAANGYECSEQDLAEAIAASGVGPVLVPLLVFLRGYVWGRPEKKVPDAADQNAANPETTPATPPASPETPNTKNAASS